MANSCLSSCSFAWKPALMLKYIHQVSDSGKKSQNSFLTHAGKNSPMTSPFYSARLHRPIPKDIKTHTTSFHTLLTLLSLLFPLLFRASTNFPVVCTLLLSIFTTVSNFLGSSLTKTKYHNSHTATISKPLFCCFAFLTFCYLLSLLPWLLLP